MRHPLLLAALLAALLYLPFAARDNSGLALLALKGAPVGLMALWAAGQARSTDGGLLAAALACGMTGDILIEGPGDGLLWSMLAFLIGHLLYGLLFWRLGARWKWPALGAGALLLAAALAILPGAMGLIFGAYAAGLVAMALLAARSRAAPLAAWGGGLFVLSDALIGANLAHLPGLPPDVSSWIIWISYVAAQLCLGLGAGCAMARFPAKSGHE